jgi:hypothetical protein
MAASEPMADGWTDRASFDMSVGDETVRDTAGAHGGCIANESVTKFVPNGYHPRNALLQVHEL